MKKDRFSTLWLTYAGVLVALQIVMGNLLQITLIGKQLNFGFLPIAVAAYLLGPVGALLVAVMGDVLGTLLFQSGYFFGFTVSEAVVGLIYGLLMYPQSLKIMDRVVSKPSLSLAVRAIAASVLSSLAYMFLNPLWLSMIGTKTYWVLFFSRLPFYVLSIPITFVLVIIICGNLKRLPPSLMMDALLKKRDTGAQLAADEKAPKS